MTTNDQYLRENSKIGDEYLRFRGLTYQRMVKVVRITASRIYFEDGGCITRLLGTTVKTSEGSKAFKYLVATEVRKGYIESNYRNTEKP